MSISIIEIKARCIDQDQARAILLRLNPEFKGKDHQIDTYFRVPQGRLKLRRGNIENTLIQYGRPNMEGPKMSNVSLYKPGDPNALYEVLSNAMDVLVEVDKVREIYFIDNVKFHIDDVKGLGTFLEIEAIDMKGVLSIDVLRGQCDKYMGLLGVRDEDLVSVSYSDLILQLQAEV